MLQSKPLLLLLLCLMLLASGGCQRKGLKCPKIGKNTTQVMGPGGKSVETTSVPYGKNGLVKKKKFLGLF